MATHRPYHPPVCPADPFGFYAFMARIDARLDRIENGHVEFCERPLRACVLLRASICICICVHMHAFDQMRFAFVSVTSFASVT